MYQCWIPLRRLTSSVGKFRLVLIDDSLAARWGVEQVEFDFGKIRTVELLQCQPAGARSRRAAAARRPRLPFAYCSPPSSSCAGRANDAFRGLRTAELIAVSVTGVEQLCAIWSFDGRDSNFPMALDLR